MLRQSLLEDFTQVSMGSRVTCQFLLPTDLTTAIAYQSSLMPLMLQKRQSLIRQTMFTLILAANRIYQVMSYKSIQTIV